MQSSALVVTILRLKKACSAAPEQDEFSVEPAKLCLENSTGKQRKSRKLTGCCATTEQ
jgi:hypothetical protein